MKRFSFRLQRVLRLRCLEREEAQRVLAQRNQELMNEQGRLNWLEQEFLRNEVTANTILPVQNLILIGDYARRLRASIEHQIQQVAAAQQRVEEARTAYLEKAKEAKGLEMLREKRLTEHRQELLKEDERFLDELSVQRAHHSRREKHDGTPEEKDTES